MECSHNHHTDEAREDVEANIEKYGCHIVLVEGGDYLPAFAYSIGLYQKFKHPEIICFGLKNDVLGFLINRVAELARDGEKMLPGLLYDDFLESYKIQFIPVDEAYYPDYFGYAKWFYGEDFDFPALELIWPDKHGLFPWEEGFNPDWKFKQPLLDRNTDFKFYEERNVCAFTTSKVLEGRPILAVYHNEDGAWQFHTGDYPGLADAKLVALETITKIDRTVNGAAHLNYGWRAYRESIDDAWKFEEHPDDQEEEPADEPPVIEQPKSLLQKLGSWFK